MCVVLGEDETVTENSFHIADTERESPFTHYCRKKGETMDLFYTHNLDVRYECSKGY